MYKPIISAVAVGAAFMLASPASAQWAPRPDTSYNNAYRPYNSYAYNDYRYGVADANYTQSLRSRVQSLRSNIQALQMRRMISPPEARRLDNEAMLVERHIYMASRNGIQQNEIRNLEIRVQRLERNIAMESRDWNNRPGGYYRG